MELWIKVGVSPVQRNAVGRAMEALVEAAHNKIRKRLSAPDQGNRDVRVAALPYRRLVEDELVPACRRGKERPNFGRSHHQLRCVPIQGDSWRIRLTKVPVRNNASRYDREI